MKAVDNPPTNTQEYPEWSTERVPTHKDRLRAAMKVLLRHIASDMQRFLNPRPLGEDNNTRQEDAVNVSANGSLPSPHKERNP